VRISHVEIETHKDNYSSLLQLGRRWVPTKLVLRDVQAHERLHILVAKKEGIMTVHNIQVKADYSH